MDFGKSRIMESSRGSVLGYEESANYGVVRFLAQLKRRRPKGKRNPSRFSVDGGGSDTVVLPLRVGGGMNLPGLGGAAKELCYGGRN